MTDTPIRTQHTKAIADVDHTVVIASGTSSERQCAQHHRRERAPAERMHPQMRGPPG